MSQTTATVRSGGVRTHRSALEPLRPTLRVISGEPGAPRQLPFVLLCTTLLGAGLLALLLLNTSLAEGAYRTHSLQTTSTQLAEDEMTLREELDTVSSAQALAGAAHKLGMLPLGQPPLTLELSTGTVRGLTRDQAPAGEDPFSVTTTPLYKPSAAKQAGPTAGATSNATAAPGQRPSAAPQASPGAAPNASSGGTSGASSNPASTPGASAAATGPRSAAASPTASGQGG